MNKDYLSIIILFCIKKFNGERSLSAIYYLLKGKKTSQTIQDSKLYHIAFLFQIFPHLSKNLIEQKTKDLLNLHFIKKNGEDIFIITKQGNYELETQFKMYPFPKELNGWKYHTSTSIFWNRLSLLIQTISNMIHQNNRFNPITKDEVTLQWIKNFIFSTKSSKSHLSEKIHHELLSLLSSMTKKEADLFMLKLTSYKRVGLTMEQISEVFGDDPYRVHVLFYGILHDMMKKVLELQNEYPILFALLRDHYNHIPLTFSTKKTYQLLLLGKSIKEIAEIRQLRISTIEDHVVELAHNLNNFSIEPFIDEDIQKEIENKIHVLKTNQLKEIKQELTNASYFQIRLVLAKDGD